MVLSHDAQMYVLQNFEKVKTAEVARVITTNEREAEWREH